MTFPNQNLANQFISSTYQDVVQTYVTESSSYFLDGLGNVISFIPTSSVGNQIVTVDQIDNQLPITYNHSFLLMGG